MTGTPPEGISDDLTAAVALRFVDLFDGCGDYLGPLGERRVASVLRSVSLRGHRRMEELSSLPVLADLAGRPDVFLGCVEALRPVPWTGNYSIYEPIRQLFCGAVRRTELDGGDPTPYRSMISLPETGAPGEPAPSSNIRSRTGGSAWKRGSGSSPTTERSGIHGLAITCMSVRELYVMWAFGGTFLFSRKRIDKEIATATFQLRELRAIR